MEQEVGARQPPISCAILRLILDVVSRVAAFSANPLARAQHRCALSSLSVCSGEVYLAIFLSLWGHDTTCPERSRMDRALVRAVPPERTIRTRVIPSITRSACAERNLSSPCINPPTLDL